MTRKEYLNIIFSTYNLVSVLSDKNDSNVLHLRHKTLNKDIILRSYKTTISAYERFANVKHKNLPLIYDSISLDDGQIILEEYIKGITVAQVMESSSYTLKGARFVFCEVCKALSVLHSYNIVHRDVKPENIIVDDQGRVVLVDFNAAREISTAKRDTVIMGTVGYASPEQLGISQSDARTDIYAAGVLLNVMLTGNHPSYQLARGKAGRIVKKCTAINPNDRYQSAMHLFNAL